jgi:predicted TIM-barrel enzyme
LTGIAFGIVATQKLAGAHAFAGQSIFHGQQRAQFRGIGAGAGAALHVVAFAAAQGYGGATGTGNVSGALREQLQGGVEIGVSHFGEGASGILRREA